MLLLATLWYIKFEKRNVKVNFQYLLSHRDIDVNKQGYEGDTALMCAVKRNQVNVVRWSTCVLVYFRWLLDHVSYLQLRSVLFKAEQIHKTTTSFTQNDNFNAGQSSVLLF